MSHSTGGELFKHSSIEDGCLVAIPLSSSETQCFVISHGQLLVDKNPNPWLNAQRLLVEKALKRAQSMSITERVIVVAGVSHFGHLIGDSLGIFIAACKQNLPRALSARLLLVNPPQSFLRLLEIIEIRQFFRVEYINQPTIIMATSGLDLLCIKNNSKKCLHTGLAMASELTMANIKKTWLKNGNYDYSDDQGVFLTPGSFSRLSNISTVIQRAEQAGWKVVDPLVHDIAYVLTNVAKSKRLISENGSILFNCFLARRRPYDVLASPRISILNREWEMGGYVYNSYHDSVINYHIGKLVEPSMKHPYSDKIFIEENVLEHLFGPP